MMLYSCTHITAEGVKGLTQANCRAAARTKPSIRATRTQSRVGLLVLPLLNSRHPLDLVRLHMAVQGIRAARTLNLEAAPRPCRAVACVRSSSESLFLTDNIILMSTPSNAAQRSSVAFGVTYHQQRPDAKCSLG